MSETDDRDVRLECLRLAVETMGSLSGHPAAILDAARDYLNFVRGKVRLKPDNLQSSQDFISPDFEKFKRELHSQSNQISGLKSA